MLPAWRLFFTALWVAMPCSQHLPARSHVLLNFLIVLFGGEARDPRLMNAGCQTRPASLATCTPSTAFTATA